jgi:hypothetical protein
VRKLLLFISVVGYIGLGCEKETNVDIPDQNLKLVIHSEQAQNDYFSITVGRSAGIREPMTLQPRQLHIINATVVVKENDTLTDTLRYNSGTGRYEGQKIRALIGKMYTVEASVAGFEKATGSSVLPGLVQPVQVNWRRNIRTDAYGGSLDEVTISFTDDIAIQDYYLIRLRQAAGEFVLCTYSNDKDIERSVSSDLFETEECLSGWRVLLADRNFNGSTKTVVLNVISAELNENIDQQGRRRRPTIELLHINKDYFQHLKSLTAYEKVRDNPFAEPANVYSNIRNGYGIFTTFALSVDSLR